MGIYLTQREREIVGLLAEGLERDEVAERMCLSVHSLYSHGENLRLKTGTRTLMAAVMTLCDVSIKPEHLETTKKDWRG